MQAQIQRIEDLRVFEHELHQIADDVESVTGYIASNTFEMRSLSSSLVDRVRAGWESRMAALDEAEREYDSYMCTPEEEIDHATAQELRQAVRDAAEAEREARADLEAIVGCQAQLEGYCSQLYSAMTGGSLVRSAIEGACDAIAREAVILEDY